MPTSAASASKPRAGASAPAAVASLALGDLLGQAEALVGAGAADQAVALYRQWAEAVRGPQAALAFVAQFNLGVLLGTAGDRAGAMAAYRAAIAIKADLFEAHLNLGTQLEAVGRTDEALACWQHVVDAGGQMQAAQQPLLLQAFNQIGRLCEQLHRYPQAEAALKRSLEIKPEQPDALQHWLHLRQRQCSWPVHQPFGQVDAHSMLMATSPLAMLAAHDDPALQLLAARQFGQRKLQHATGTLASGRRYNHSRLRIGYLSGDLCTHAVGLLLADLMAQHDRTRVEVFAFCSSPEDGTPYRARLMSTFEHVHRIQAMDDAQAAQLILACEIDVLVDMHGLSAGTRQGILALRPAPVQATWLGFMGTTALPWIDHVIVDRFVLPPDQQPCFSERPLYLDSCFLPGDRHRETGAALSRAQAGLPDDRFVFASFNNAYKLNPVMFDSWMRILRAVPDSVLWLLDDNPSATANLKAFAADRGVGPQRLVFAPRVVTADYRARLALADLFLDNHPYNAGSTANDVLWAGTPMLTLSGRTIVSRMGGSLLTALHLPELVTHSHGDYEAKAIALAHDRAQLQALRERLHQARHHSAAFDMAALARQLEDSLALASARRSGAGAQAGTPP
ncbi:MAG: tetratricopeptide repeat protein [Aquabacterium sp.]|nr:tetratricopeptide repeat protein [Aquabacterium sp.]